MAETACGKLIQRLGIVKCKGSVEGSEIEIMWNHMKVKCPIPFNLAVDARWE